jgi:hypothetical protein
MWIFVISLMKLEAFVPEVQINPTLLRCWPKKLKYGDSRTWSGWKVSAIHGKHHLCGYIDVDCPVEPDGHYDHPLGCSNYQTIGSLITRESSF